MLQIENRGTEEVPFGFVYADDAERRSFFTISGDILTIGGSGSGYIESLTQDEMQAAKRMLIGRFTRPVIV